MATIGFDADDTLWANEEMFAQSEELFRKIAAPWASAEEADAALLQTERTNVKAFGFGVKSFCLSMIETIIDLSAGAVSTATIAEITQRGHQMMTAPTVPLAHVTATLRELRDHYRLLVITKGDLLHQLRRVADSGIAALVDDVEVVPTKDPATYTHLLERHRIDPDRFVMVGNSLGSDIVPVLAIGGRAIHVPYHLQWALDRADPPPPSERWSTASSIAEVPKLVSELLASPIDALDPMVRHGS